MANGVEPMARILVIDDEELARFTIREILEGSAHVVTEASDGIEGMRCLQADAFDIAITDMVMPQQEGSKTIEAIKDFAPSVKVIAISGGGRVNNVDHLDRAMAAGADAILKKPFTYEEFLDTVENLLVPEVGTVSLLPVMASD